MTNESKSFKKWWTKNKERFTFKKITTFEVAVSGILVALWVVSYKYISIDLTFTKIGITHAWIAIVGLTIRPALGVLTCAIGDNLCLLLGGNIARWMLIYAIIPFLIYFLAYFFKKTMLQKKEGTWKFLIFVSTCAICLGTFFTMYFNEKILDDVASTSSESFIDLSSLLAQIITWVALAGMLLVQAVLLGLYFRKKTPKLKLVLSMYSLMSLVIVIGSWVIGPIAEILYYQRFLETFGWDWYSVFLVARILKTPLVLPIYTLIVTTCFKIGDLFVKTNVLSKL